MTTPAPDATAATEAAEIPAAVDATEAGPGPDVPDQATLLAVLFGQAPPPDEAAAPVVEAKPAAEPAATKEPQDPALDRLIKREAQARERELAVRAQETALTEKLAAIKRAEDFQARVKDPYAAVAYLKAAGVDLATLAKAAWSEELGEAAPAEHKARVRERTIHDELAEIKAKLAAQEGQAAQAVHMARAQAEAVEWAGGLSTLAAASDETPLVKAYMAANPAAAQDRLYRAALRIGELRRDKGYQDVVPTHQEVCKALNDALAEYAPIYQAANPAPTPAPQTRAPRPPKNTPAARPSVDEQDEASLRAAAYQALFGAPRQG